MVPGGAAEVLVQRHAHAAGAIGPAQRQRQRRLARLLLVVAAGAQELHGGRVRSGAAVWPRVVVEHGLVVTVTVTVRRGRHGGQASSHGQELHVGVQAVQIGRPLLHRRGVRRRREVIREPQAGIVRHLRQGRSAAARTHRK